MYKNMSLLQHVCMVSVCWYLVEPECRLETLLAMTFTRATLKHWSGERLNAEVPILSNLTAM